jgi:NAD(P)-dependent dehydrogenase (short-subunit alcohol dehydrogenase family)
MIKRIMLSKTVIVTGATGNLGQAVVKKFIENDYHVWGTVHPNPGKNISEKNLSGNGNLNEIALDLLDEEACKKLVDDVVAHNQKIDVAVLTAGGFTMGDLPTTKTSDIAKQYQLNFETAYNIAKPVFVQMMKQNKGRIFLIGSKAGLDNSKAIGVTAYGLSKSLIFGLAKIINAEAHGKNVVASVIVPGTIDTPQNRKSMPDADFSAWVLPSKIADVIYFYANEEGDVLREPVVKVYGRS